MLNLTYDENFIHRWMHYTTITGDTKFLEVNTQIVGGIKSRIVAKLYPRNNEIVRVFERDRNYRKIVEFLNYPTLIGPEKWQQEAAVHRPSNLLAIAS